MDGPRRYVIAMVCYRCCSPVSCNEAYIHDEHNYNVHLFVILVLNKNPEEVDQRSADMWSFAILLWEMSTREVPFVDMPPMEVGMKVRNVSIFI